MYKTFQDAGYNVVYNNQQLKATSNNKKTLGVFSSKFLACHVLVSPQALSLKHVWMMFHAL